MTNLPRDWPDGRPATDGWTVQARREVVRDRHLHLFAETVAMRNGHLLDPYWVIELSDFVVVTALTPGEEMVLVRQWRQAAKAWVVEPPGGVIDAGEDPCTTALRELREETGYAGASARLVASPWADPTRQTNRVHAVLVEGAVLAGPPAREATEDMETLLLPLARVRAGLPEGLLAHTLHLACVMLSLHAAGRVGL